MNYLPKEGFIKEHAKGIARIVMLQVVDRLWLVKLYSYLCAGAAYQFSSGWSAFVRENTLQVGDVCVFELVMMRGDVVFKVDIFKCPENVVACIVMDHHWSSFILLLSVHRVFFPLVVGLEWIMDVIFVVSNAPVWTILEFKH